MAQARSPIELMSALITRARKEAGDPAVTPAGETIPVQARMFTDDQYMEAINDVLIEMSKEMDLRLDEPALAFVDMDYSDTSGLISGVALPAGIDARQIVRVSDITDGVDYARTVFWVPTQDLDATNKAPGDIGTAITMHWSLLAGALGVNIVLMPTNVARRIRIWYVASPLIVTATNDQVLLSETWKELLALKAAISLISIIKEPFNNQLRRLSIAWANFQAFAKRVKTPLRVTMVRR